MVRGHDRQLEAELRPLDVSPGVPVAELVEAVAGALADGPALLPVAGHDTRHHRGPAPPDGTAAVVGTSGSTGEPKLVVLPRAALWASAAATLEHLGGPGQWLLALPAQHVAGFQVLVRSALAGTVPVPVPGDGFTPGGFARAAAALTGARHYAALVPTQLRRILADEMATEALARLDGVLVGGASLSGPLSQRARDAGVRLVTTYGMTETCGGCVYDGRPLPDVQVELDDTGRVRLVGAVVAGGYLGAPQQTAERFTVGADGTRSYLTDDVAELGADGRVTVLGRRDDVITTGGVKVAPRPVQEALLALPEVADAVVLAVPDEEWGQRVAAVLVPRTSEGAPSSLGEVRDALRGSLPAPALPRQVHWLPAIPSLPSGKPDRSRLVRLLTDTGGRMTPRSPSTTEPWRGAP